MCVKLRWKATKTHRHESDIILINTKNIIKGQLQRFYKLMSYERAFKMLKNNMCITEIGQAVLKL